MYRLPFELTDSAKLLHFTILGGGSADPQPPKWRHWRACGTSLESSVCGDCWISSSNDTDRHWWSPVSSGTTLSLAATSWRAVSWPLATPGGCRCAGVMSSPWWASGSDACNLGQQDPNAGNSRVAISSAQVSRQFGTLLVIGAARRRLRLTSKVWLHVSFYWP